jgi:uncharacterized protein YkwD
VGNNTLVQYALSKINEDREKYGLSPVLLSNNRGAQLHAEDMLKTRQISHWTTDGMKPYMKYTIYRGTGYVRQNVGYDGITDLDTISKCKSGEYNCSLTNPMKSIDIHEYNMMYNDSKSNWGHRDNILDKHHTHVSIGIAYDDYYFAFVQNFENNYIQSTDGKPVIQVDNDSNNVQITGNLIQNYDSNNIVGIRVYYDEMPNQLIYEQHKDDTFYQLGKQIAYIVKPLPPNYHYEQPSNYTLIQADKWRTLSSPSSSLSSSMSSEGNQQLLFDIQFNISALLTTQGVHTIVTYIKNNDDNKDIFPIS